MEKEKGPEAPEAPRMMLIAFPVAQAVLNYLAKHPCGEVYAMVTELLNLKEALAPAEWLAPPIVTANGASAHALPVQLTDEE